MSKFDFKKLETGYFSCFIIGVTVPKKLISRVSIEDFLSQSPSSRIWDVKKRLPDFRWELCGKKAILYKVHYEFLKTLDKREVKIIDCSNIAVINECALAPRIKKHLMRDDIVWKKTRIVSMIKSVLPDVEIIV